MKLHFGSNRSVKIPAFLFCIGVVLFFAGCDTTTTASNESTPRSPLGMNQALGAAMDIQDLGKDREAGIAHGQSMAPLYGENTVLIISPIDYMDLERGMLVAYRNSSGHRVVHQLVRRDEYGWVARGIGNDTYDAEYVTVHNLEGVVYGAFFAMN